MMRTPEQSMVNDHDDRISSPDQSPGLSKKSQKMLGTILDRSQLDIYGYPGEDVNPIKSRTHADTIVKSIQYEALKRDVPLETLGPAFMRPLEPLISPNSFVRHSHFGLGEVTRDDIPMIVRTLFNHRENPHHMQNAVVRTVFGATPTYPLRALSYLIPSLELVDSMRRSRMYPNLPQIQYFFMSHVGKQVNGLDPEVVDSSTDQMMQMGKAFVDHFYPELVDYVVFCDDAVFAQSDSVHTAHERLLRDEKIHDQDKFQRVITRLHISGKNGVEHYALFHPLVHDVSYPGEELFHDRSGRPVNNQPAMIVNIGAQTEKPFYGIRRVCRDRLEDVGLHPVDTLQYFTRHRTPPYLPMLDDGVRQEDISLSDAVSDPSKVRQVVFLDRDNNLMRRDMDILTQEKPLDLLDFLQTYRVRSNV